MDILKALVTNAGHGKGSGIPGPIPSRPTGMRSDELKTLHERLTEVDAKKIHDKLHEVNKHDPTFAKAVKSLHEVYLDTAPKSMQKKPHFLKALAALETHAEGISQRKEDERKALDPNHYAISASRGHQRSDADEKHGWHEAWKKATE